MECNHVKLPNGISAIVCSSRRRRAKPCACGRPSTRLCDWKIVGEFEIQRIPGQLPKQATCDTPLCDACTHSPTPDKDLCPTHAKEWLARSAVETRDEHGN